MGISIHLSYSGQCEAAFLFYQRSLAGTFETSIALTRYGDTPMAAQMPDDWRDKIVHGNITIGDATLAGADVLPKDYQAPCGFSVLLDVQDPEAAERVFHALAENGIVTMPIQQTFWAKRFGVLTDQFGVPWEINSGAGPS